MFVFLHMIVVCAKASWLNKKLEFFSNSKHSVPSSCVSVNRGGGELCKAVSE